MAPQSGTSLYLPESKVGSLWKEADDKPSLRFVDEPSGFDVLCGKQATAFGHPGNKRFRSIIACHIDNYYKAPNRTARSKVVKAVYAKFLLDGVRFLRTDPATGRWYAIDDQESREKISHTFRDRVRERSKNEARRRNAAAKVAAAGKIIGYCQRKGQSQYAHLFSEGSMRKAKPNPQTNLFDSYNLVDRLSSNSSPFNSPSELTIPRVSSLVETVTSSFDIIPPTELAAEKTQCNTQPKKPIQHESSEKRDELDIYNDLFLSDLEDNANSSATDSRIDMEAMIDALDECEGNNNNAIVINCTGGSRGNNDFGDVDIERICSTTTDVDTLSKVDSKSWEDDSTDENLLKDCEEEKSGECMDISEHDAFSLQHPDENDEDMTEFIMRMVQKASDL